MVLDSRTLTSQQFHSILEDWMEENEVRKQSERKEQRYIKVTDYYSVIESSGEQIKEFQLEQM